MVRTIDFARGVAIVGLVGGVLAFAATSVALMARREYRWGETFEVRTTFRSVSGLAVGDAVRVQGMTAGVVDRIDPPARAGEPVVLTLRVDAKHRELIRSDALARIETQGVVGARVVEIQPGDPEAPALGTGPEARISSVEPIEIAQVLEDARRGLGRIEEVAGTADAGLREIHAIAESIRNGRGTLGLMVNDESAYRQIVELGHRGEKTLTELEENLTAMKHTWPISRFFNDRAYFDKDRLLVRTGARRESRVFREEELFEPGRSALTANGRRRLDEFAAWFKGVNRSKTELVIAGFTDAGPGTGRDRELAEILTQDQADAVKEYLSTTHKLDSTGWFSSRKVAAAGFGDRVPAALRDEAEGRPARRLEILLFTPN